MNEAYGYDSISTRMIKICDSSILKPLSIIFRNSLNSGIFPNNWKRSNIVPVHKKRKQAINTKLSPYIIIAD